MDLRDLSGAILDVLSAPPSPAWPGRFYLDSSIASLRVYLGNQWLSFPLGFAVPSKAYDISFSSDPYIDIDVGADGFNAYQCLVQVKDKNNDYMVINGFDILSPDQDTIRIQAGGNETGDFLVLVLGVV